MNQNASPIYSVSQVNQYIKRAMDGDSLLSALLVHGEISNYKAYPSGHHYFSLKDDSGTIRCVMFRSDAVRLKCRLENGMKVIVFGRITVFPRDGQYQLYCNELVPDGIGDLHTAFEALKQKLNAEGLFDVRHKKKIPEFPDRIALVTSSAGAAVRDMLRILGTRWPMAQVILVPVRVQGSEAAQEIAAAITRVNREQLAELIITGRGGGSMEDLWAFNEEVVARAIYESVLPVISAVGHEPDVTIADYVADLRAATPSNAAELAVPDQNEINSYLRQLCTRMGQGMQRKVSNARSQLTQLAERRVLQSLMAPIEDKRLLLDYQGRQLGAAYRAILLQKKAEMERLAAALDALSPLKVLGRGYSILQKKEHIVSSVTQVAEQEQVSVFLTDGTLTCTVMGKEFFRGRKENEL